MAKLSAHGTELLRIRREYILKLEPDEPERQQTKHFEERSYRSDGHIMSKSGFWMTATIYQKPYWYDWGWKLFKKLKPEVRVEDHVAKVRAAIVNRVVETPEDWRIVS